MVAAPPQSIADALGLSEETLIGRTSSSPYSGSPTFDEVPLHVEATTPLLATFAVVRTERDDFVHYGTVIEGTEENPRADPGVLQQNRAYRVGIRDPRPGDLAPHVTRILKLQVMGELYLQNGTIAARDPQSLPQTGREVHVLAADVLPGIIGAPTDPDDGLELGVFESGGKTATVRLPLEALARHIAIVGKTGVGKSHAGGVLVEEAVRLGVPVVAFDVLGDLVAATDELHGRNYVADTRDFQVPYSIVGLSEFLAFIPNLTRDQQEIVSAAYDRVYYDAIQQLQDTGRINIPIQQLLDEITAIGESAGQAPVAKRAALRVAAMYHRTSLLTERTQDWLDQLKTLPVVNIYVGHLQQHRRNLVVAATARMLQILRRRDAIPPFLLVLDEAHLFLHASDSSPSISVIREMVRTARHDAIGIVLLTPSPSSMDRQTFLICNTRLVFALDPEDLRLVAGHLHDMPESVINRIPRMRRGRCILTSAMDILRHSVQLDVRERATPSGAPTPNLAKEAALWRDGTKH